MATFFEIHYYDGGLKTELVPGGSRPSVLPEPTGPRSTELELHEGESTVELQFTSRQNHTVIWIGIYTFSFDKQHGARGNYCGVGVWLIDLAPIFVNRLLNNLSTIASRVSEQQGPSRDIVASLEKAANDFNELGWCVPIGRWPHALSEARYKILSDGSTRYLVGRQDDELDLKLVAADILHQFTRRPKSKSDEPSRRVYLTRRSSRVPASELVEIDYPAVLSAGEQAIFEMCDVTAEPMAKQNRLIDQQRKAAEEHAIAVAELRGNLAAQIQRSDNLQASLNISEEQRLAMQETFAAVKRFMSDGGDSNAAGFSARLNEIHEIVSKSQTRLNDIDEQVLRWTNGGATHSVDQHAIDRRRWSCIEHIPLKWLVLGIAVAILGALAATGLWYLSYYRTQAHHDHQPATKSHFVHSQPRAN